MGKIKGKLSIENKAELLVERIFDVLWHNNVIIDDCDENKLKSIIMKDIIIQLKEFYEDTL